jgi:gluconolactonase
MSGRPLRATADLRTIAVGLDHPEGVAFGPDGMLYAGGEAGQVYRVDPASGTVDQIADTDGYVLGVALDAAGAIYVCDAIHAAILRVGTDGIVERYCERTSDGPLKIPNWLAFATDGALIFSDSGTEGFDVMDGRIVVVPPGGGDGRTLELNRPLHFPNGLAVDRAGVIYFVETFTPRLSRVVDGRIETLLELPRSAPDGVALTADGGLVISCYYPYRVLHLPLGATAPEVLLEDEVGLSLPNPTNVAFFGSGLETLAIAAHGGQFLAALDVPFSGAPLHRP